MKDRKFHTNKELKDNYPKPGVPAEEAWAEMNKMLGPVPANLPPAKRLIIKGLGKFIWYLTSVVAVVIVTVVAFHYSNTKKKNTTVISSTNNKPVKKNVNDRVIQQDTLTPNDKLIDPSSKSVPVIDSASKINSSTANTEGNADNTSIKNDAYSPIYNDSAGFVLKKNTADNKPGNVPGAPLQNNSAKTILQKNKTGIAILNANSRDNNQAVRVSKNKFGNKEKNNDQRVRDKNIFGELSVRPGHKNGNHAGNRDRTISHEQNNNTYNKQHNPTAINHYNPVMTNKELTVKINTPGSSFPARTASFIKEPISTDTSIDLQVDTSYAKQIKNTLKDRSSKKHTSKSKNKKSTIHKRASSGLGYGLQWDVSAPIQGTTNYFTGSDGKSKPYNILIPQLWLSKELSGKSKIFFKINVNQQYVAGNKKLAADTAAPPLDSTYHKTTLLKTGGYSATLQYSYSPHKNWGTSVGVTYSVNRNALLNKREISTYRGDIESDIIYGIKRSSADWHYIKNNQLSGNAELYYIFKKFNIGASIYLPFSNIPIYGNKNVHPVNVQFFLRWNIKKE